MTMSKRLTLRIWTQLAGYVSSVFWGMRHTCIMCQASWQFCVRAPGYLRVGASAHASAHVRTRPRFVFSARPSTQHPQCQLTRPPFPPAPSHPWVLAIILPFPLPLPLLLQLLLLAAAATAAAAVAAAASAAAAAAVAAAADAAAGTATVIAHCCSCCCYSSGCCCSSGCRCCCCCRRCCCCFSCCCCCC